MKINQLKIKNFLSYGEDKFYTINFDKFSDLTIIKGDNGAGKSSILKALIWGLYGKLPNLSNKNISNSFFPKTEIQLSLSLNSTEIKINRKLNPSNLSVFINEEIIDLPSKLKMQEELESRIKIPYSIFCNYVAINSTNFKSILKMSPKDRREIFENILGFQEINDFSLWVSKKSGGASKQYQHISGQEHILKNQEEKINKNLKKIENELNEVSYSDKEEDLKKIEILSKEIEGISLDLNQNNQNFLKIKAKFEVLNDKLANNKEKIKLFNSNFCPTCKRPFDKTDNIKSELIKEQENIVSSIKKGKKLYNSLKDKVKELNSRVQFKKYELKELEDNYNKNINRASLVENEFNNYHKILTDIEKEKKEVLNDLSKKQLEIDYYKKLKVYLGDSGFKKILINNVIPTLNNLIDEYKKFFDLDFEFSFNEELNCDIFRGDVVLSGKSLSKGEAEKSDLIVILSLLEIIKSKIPEFNLIFLDEMFGALSPTSEEKAIKLMRFISNKLKIKSFIVTHHEYSLSNSYDELFIEKINGFSKINFNKNEG